MENLQQQRHFDVEIIALAAGFSFSHLRGPHAGLTPPAGVCISGNKNKCIYICKPRCRKLAMEWESSVTRRAPATVGIYLRDDVPSWSEITQDCMFFMGSGKHNT